MKYLYATAALALLVTPAFAQDAPKIPCPTPGEKCKVLFLSEAEENLLSGKNGILDTAAQGRQIDLGGFAVYFKSKLATAPQGEVKPIADPVAPKSDKDNSKPAIDK